MATDQSLEAPRDHAEHFPIRRWLGRNALINLALIGLSLALAIWVSPWGALLWPLAILADDVALFLTRRTMFDTVESVQAAYRWQNAFFTGTSGAGRDLGFNYYNGDTTKSRAQAQRDKWDHVFAKLELKPGDRVMDVGCGFGDWLAYLRDRGVIVRGVNLSDEQAHYARESYGLDVIQSDWRALAREIAEHPDLLGQFDTVTFMDTIEHYVHAADRRDPGAADRIYTEVFAFADALLDPETQNGRVFVSCLHFAEDNPRQPQHPERHWTKILYLTNLLMIRTYSGSYPLGPQGLTRNAAQWFDEVDRTNQTEDYRFTAIVDDDHFQDPTFKFGWRKALWLPVFTLLDPHFVHKWINQWMDAWMRTFGTDYLSPTYDPAYRERVSHVALWWILLRRKGALKSLTASHQS